MTAAQQKLLELMTEDEWQSRVIAYAALLKLLVWHDNDSRRNDAGFLDLVIVGPGGLAFAELKREKGGRVSPEQHQWIDALTAAGIEVHVWRPSDWPHVQVDLQRLAGRPPHPRSSR